MQHVDALSRRVLYVETLPLERELEYKQLQDAKLREIAHYLEYNEHKKFELIDGLVYRKRPDRSRFALPDAMLNNVIKIYHDEMGHCSVEKTFQGMYASYWFPSLRKRIRDYVENCVTCLTANAASNVREDEMQLTSVPTLSNELLYIDHFGPLPETADGYTHVLVIVDAFTR